MTENVRPRIIEEAVKLLENFLLQKYCGIKVDTSNLMKTPVISNTNKIHIRDENNEDNFEDEQDPEKELLNVRIEESWLISAIVFDPAEGRKPVSLFDKYAEVMSLIKIYGGELVT